MGKLENPSGEALEELIVCIDPFKNLDTYSCPSTVLYSGKCSINMIASFRKTKLSVFIQNSSEGRQNL